MFRVLRRVTLRLAIPLALIALAASAHAYTSSISLTAPQAGEGSATVGGFTIQSSPAPQLTYDASNPQQIDSVTLTVSPSPDANSTMKLQLYSGGSWYGCSNSGATLTCSTSATVTASPPSLSLVVAD